MIEVQFSKLKKTTSIKFQRHGTKRKLFTIYTAHKEPVFMESPSYRWESLQETGRDIFLNKWENAKFVRRKDNPWWRVTRLDFRMILGQGRGANFFLHINTDHFCLAYQSRRIAGTKLQGPSFASVGKDNLFHMNTRSMMAEVDYSSYLLP